MNLSCIIIDDDAKARASLVRLVSAEVRLQLVGVYSNGNQALEEILKGTVAPDITFLDIELGGISGIDVAREIKEMTTVIFVSGHPLYAAESYDIEIIDFLVKPVSQERLTKSIDKILAHRPQNSQDTNPSSFITLPISRGKIKFLYDDIIYLESSSNYTKVITSGGVEHIYLSMERMEALLPVKKFVRVHRSFLINFDKFKSYSDGIIYMESNKAVPLGRKYKSAFLDLLKI